MSMIRFAVAVTQYQKRTTISQVLRRLDDKFLAD